MIVFGIMTTSMESEPAYITDIANLAESCGMECYRFIPTNINPLTLQVNGKKFIPSTKSWVDNEFPIPAIVYDRCFYGDDDHSKQCIPIVSWLKNRPDITFLGYGLPNKLDLYEVLKSTVLSAYLPLTQSASNTNIVLNELTIKKRIILKPINGSQGNGIYYLKKNNKSWHVKTEKHKNIISRIFPNETKLTKWLQPLISKRPYLMQPYLELSNDELQPFDLRILLQKRHDGKWGEMGRGIRIGSTGGILSNLSAGGSILPYADWSSSFLPAKKEYINQEIEYILSNLPPILENAFLPLFEIGIDIGIAKNGSIWILDINSKPGRKVLLHTQPDIKETLNLAPLLYGKHLSQLDLKERKSYYEKTLSH
ncbi:YheC/YheD family endospore coat-associated protein [Bacillaceae bacterium C204]|uniref:YheC/YheD family endospore coat-associated protein n=1 Tax=Neobacillus sp. 204 TaxID=3383351 RepID=UPI0039784393